MNKRDMDFIIRFALASSATVILSGCLTGCMYGPTPNNPWDGGLDSNDVQEVPIPHDE
jgi:hypothetical protein